MNVCIDVGNTTIAMGFYVDGKISSRYIHNTDINRTEDQYLALLKDTLSSLNIDEFNIKDIIFSSVVPSINQPFKAALKKVFVGVNILTIGPGIKTGLALKVDNPNEIGNDLIADLVGAKEKYGYPTLIADLGTASKVLLLDKNGAFVSCVIVPGLSLSANSLMNKAALLPDISLEAPNNILAKNTVEAMRAGIVFGHADMINGLINRYEKEIGYPCKHILTGGSAIYLRDTLDESFIYDVNLTLDGLNLLLEKNK